MSMNDVEMECGQKWHSNEQNGGDKVNSMGAKGIIRSSKQHKGAAFSLSHLSLFFTPHL